MIDSQPDRKDRTAALDHLGIGDYTYADLYSPERLASLDRAFLAYLAAADKKVATEFDRYRAALGGGFSERDESNLLVGTAPYLAEFVALLFDVADQRNLLMQKARDQAAIFEFKKLFVQRRVRKLDAEKVLAAVAIFHRLQTAINDFKRTYLTNDDATDDEELATARLWQMVSENPVELEILLQWLAALAIIEPHRIRHWVSWKQPQTLDYNHLVQIERKDAQIPECIT
ncbi:MAG: hypothetical protein ABI882_06550, partial [Acidobacteriota bacterium]